MSDLRSSPWSVAEQDIGIAKLRIVAPDAEARLSDALNLPSPAAGRMTRSDHIACLRLGPNEWLVIGNDTDMRSAMARTGEAFHGDLALMIDMTHGSVLMYLSGPQAIERLSAYCDLDLHPERFRTGHATRTRFGDIAVTLARIDDRPSFWMIGDQSYAGYLAHLLDHGALPAPCH